MMIRISACFILILTLQRLSAQQTVTVSGEAQSEWYRHESRDDIERRLKHMAAINALEKAFGKVVFQGNATYIENIQTGQKIESNSSFNMIANTSVSGQVESELSCTFTDVKGYKIVEGRKEEVTEIKCEITVTASKITTPPVEFDAYTTVCTNPNCITENFRNNSDLFLFFKTPASGYLSVFLDDGSLAYRILPYRGMAGEMESAVPVKADIQYILFSIEENTLPVQDYVVDEYQLTTTKQQELNRLFIIFCEESMKKPALSGSSPEELLPDNLPSEEFQKWLQKNRSYFGEKMQVKIADLRITAK